MDRYKFYNEDCINIIKKMPDESVDIILTDPPYLYLKNQILDSPFDENLLFQEFYRVLKPTGCLICFGRGDSFYRWNTMFANLGLVFKEEIIWNKIRTGSPTLPIGRVHETIVIRGKKDYKIQKSKVEYTEAKKLNIQGAITDIKRIRTALNRPDLLIKMENILKGEEGEYNKEVKNSFGVTCNKSIKKEDDPSLTLLRNFENGVRERTIIDEQAHHYGMIHPTQKPVKLLKRLLKLSELNNETLVFDPFMGSCSTGIACKELGVKFVGCEIHTPYYNAALENFNSVTKNPTLF